MICFDNLLSPVLGAPIALDYKIVNSGESRYTFLINGDRCEIEIFFHMI